MGIEAEDVSRFMIKKEGEPIAKEELLASYNAFFGLIKKRVYSPVTGTVEAISDE